jgi:uncharacterized protein with PIN domain
VTVEAARAYFRFYGELNDHLAAGQGYKTLEKSFFVPSAVKDLIESFGVPHTEVELIIANGESVDFSYVVRAGDRIAVYPMFESVDVAPELRVRTKTLRNPKFVLDAHLGKLAAYLRMLGFDTMYRNTFTDPELVRISSEEERILLTRDRGLLKHSAVTRGYWLRETDSRRQISEILQRFDLADSVEPFARCMRCNGVLQPVSKDQAHRSLLPRMAERNDEFRRCPECGRIYWKGSHHARMVRWIEELISVH